MNQTVRGKFFTEVTLPSGSSECKFMWVQVPSSAPKTRQAPIGACFVFCADNRLRGIMPPFWVLLAKCARQECNKTAPRRKGFLN